MDDDINYIWPKPLSDSRRFAEIAVWTTEDSDNLAKRRKLLLRRLKTIFDWISDRSIELSRKEEKQRLLQFKQLHITAFDNEQIWQQICANDDVNYRRLRRKSIRLFKLRSTAAAHSNIAANDSDRLAGQIESDDEEEIADDSTDKQQSIIDEGDKSIDQYDEEEEEEEEEEKQGNEHYYSKKTSEVDDDIFRLADMETFCDAEEKRDEESTMRSPILDLDDEHDEHAKSRYYYEDFFGSKDIIGQLSSSNEKKKEKEEKEEKSKTKNVRFEDDNREDEQPEMLSTFEKRQEKLRKKISAIEDDILRAKRWEMSGEAAANSREKNELLDVHLAFEHASKSVPLITKETTERLEAIIEQRIRDKTYDDVIRTVKSTDDPKKYREALLLDQQKSTQSLANIYEQEYNKHNQTDKVDDLGGKNNAKHDEIKRGMSGLFAKLDALYNYHYTPKSLVAEVRIMKNMPSLELEEVGPTAASDSVIVAPEEAKQHERGDLKANDERSETDRARERRKKKKKAAALSTGEEKKRKRNIDDDDGEEVDEESIKKRRLKKNVKKPKMSKTRSSTFFAQLDDQTIIDSVKKKTRK